MHIIISIEDIELDLEINRKILIFFSSTRKKSNIVCNKTSIFDFKELKVHKPKCSPIVSLDLHLEISLYHADW